MAKILLLEDEADLRFEVVDFLRSEGHTVLHAASVAEFGPQIDLADIAIIDIGLPDGNGFDVAQKLRKTHPHMGIIILTARGASLDKINGLKIGADHYLVKPVRFAELAAHIASVARRVAPSIWRLHLVERKLTAPDGGVEKMTSVEMIMLELLARNAGSVVLRPAIAKAFGTDWLSYDERHLDQLVSRLRRRWRKHNGTELPLRTEHGLGYSLCVDIEIN
ncbi:DNA-binding response regulator [Oxalobacteraceae bacterium CAVE-383]|nr:DNA-binding response regulator [Oxalobacteraceae bacterium CAVE-383]